MKEIKMLVVERPLHAAACLRNLTNSDLGARDALLVVRGRKRLDASLLQGKASTALVNIKKVFGFSCLEIFIDGEKVWALKTPERELLPKDISFINKLLSEKPTEASSVGWLKGLLARVRWAKEE